MGDTDHIHDFNLAMPLRRPLSSAKNVDLLREAAGVVMGQAENENS